jgi:hypothetical protein
MADQNPRDRGANSPDPDSAAARDARTENAVLTFLLDEHPTRLTLGELSLVLNADPRLNDPPSVNWSALGSPTRTAASSPLRGQRSTSSACERSSGRPWRG